MVVVFAEPIVHFDLRKLECELNPLILYKFFNFLFLTILTRYSSKKSENSSSSMSNISKTKTPAGICRTEIPEIFIGHFSKLDPYKKLLMG